MSDYFTRAAFLKYLQNENGCKRTGKRCRDAGKCGCDLELDGYIQAERMSDDVKSMGQPHD